MFGIGYLWVQKTVLKELADIVKEKKDKSLLKFRIQNPILLELPIYILLQYVY